MTASKVFAPSTYQANFFNWVATARGSCVLVAVAGSGKTTSVIEALVYVPPRQSVVLLAFNAAIAKELTQRVADKFAELTAANDPRAIHYSPQFVSAKTFHSLGYGAVRKHLEKRGVRMGNPDDKKVRGLAREYLGADTADYEMYADYAVKLVGLAKGQGIGCLVPDVDATWYDLAGHHDLYLDDEKATEERAVELARELLRRSNAVALTRGLIDFDDMLYLVCKWGLKLWQNDWLFVDEAQDTNPVRRALAKLALRPGGRLVAVGDPCQPIGTKVERVVIKSKFNVDYRESIDITEVKVGDHLTSYRSYQGQVARRVLGITTKPYSGQLVTAEVDGFKSRYTLAHRCVVRNRRSDWCVYLMRRGDAFRVGMSRLWMSEKNGGVGPWLRLKAEKADAVWILDTFNTRHDALVAEAVVSARFGLPQLMFTFKDGQTIFTQDDLNAVWCAIKNEAAAQQALRFFGRDLRFPYFVKSDKMACLRRRHVARACNILNGSEVLLKSNDWKEAVWGLENYTGDVVSLSVDLDEQYFADNILTHNCQAIYGFTGASHDAIELLKHEFNAIELPLTVCYRCAQDVVAAAQPIVPHLEAFAGAPQGKVETLKLKEALPHLGAHDAVLCRQTAPLIKLAYTLVGQGTGCRVLGRDIGAGLVSLVKRTKARGLDQLQAKLETYREREMAKFVAKGQEQKADALNDRVESVFTVMGSLDENHRTVPALITAIESLFGDTNGCLTLSTVHKAKGREWETVAILEPELMPSKYARQDWQAQQEQNLIYVAYTRAKLHLIFIETEKKPA